MNRGQSLLSMKNVRYKDIRYSMSKRGRNIFMSIWTGASHLIPLLLLAWVSRLDVSQAIRFRHQPPQLQSTRTYPTPPVSVEIYLLVLSHPWPTSEIDPDEASNYIMLHPFQNKCNSGT